MCEAIQIHPLQYTLSLEATLPSTLWMFRQKTATVVAVAVITAVAVIGLFMACAAVRDDLILVGFSSGFPYWIMNSSPIYEGHYSHV